MPAVADNRRDKRLALRLPMKFSVEMGDQIHLYDGLTSNVSSGGLYFVTPVDHVRPSDQVCVRIAVPAFHGDEKPNLTLVGEGVALRVEKMVPENITNFWPQTQSDKLVYGVALQFQQRPTVQLHSFEDLLWEERGLGGEV